MGTAISEREFKVASDITSGDRARLLPENAEKLLFLKYNLRSIGYKSCPLSVPVRQEQSCASPLLLERVENDEGSSDCSIDTLDD